MKTIFKVVGYDIKTTDGNFLESCIFWIYADTKDEAIEKAKLYKTEKKEYAVLEVIEKIKEFDART